MSSHETWSERCTRIALERIEQVRNQEREAGYDMQPHELDEDMPEPAWEAQRDGYGAYRRR